MFIDIFIFPRGLRADRWFISSLEFLCEEWLLTLSSLLHFPGSRLSCLKSVTLSGALLPLTFKVNMTSVSDIILELDECKQLIVSPGTSQAVKDALITSLSSKIAGLQTLTSQLAVQLVAALEASNLPQQHYDTLNAAINTRLEDALTTSGDTKKGCLKQQVLVNICAYPTAEEWTKLLTPGTDPTDLITILVKIVGRVGVRSLHEQTCKWAIALVLHIILEQTHRWPTYHTIYDWVLKFKRNFDAVKFPWRHEMLTVFPDDPRQLPAAVYQVAYADNPPVTKAFSITYLGDHISLRSNSALLERERQAGVGGHPYM